MDIHQELKELSKFLSEYSTSLMAVGVQTSRIVRNTAR
ncbi:threonine/serine exporter, partial [Escherichia coli]|nr:threonine/serine exporter [Escherichia coli]